MMKAMQEGKNALLESPTGTGKTVCLLCAALAFQEAQKHALNRVAPSKQTSGPPIIIYVSRTHSQLAQAVKELKTTKYNPKFTVLGSRKNLCVNKNVRARQGAEQIRACRNLTEGRNCNYQNGLKSLANMATSKDKANASALDPWLHMDIEDMVKEGEAQGVCPYFLSRDQAVQGKVDIVFMPYNFITSPQMRKGLSVRWENAIVIVDEAHNFQSVACDASSFSITKVDIAMAAKVYKAIVLEDLYFKRIPTILIPRTNIILLPYYTTF